MTRLAVGLVALALVAAAFDARAAEEVVVRVLVEDDAGTPVEGASVRGFFFDEQVLNRRLDGNVAATTDAYGRAEISGTEDLYVDLQIDKDGYYRSTRRVLVRELAAREEGSEERIRLRPKRDPTAMYAKEAILVGALQAGEPYAYDLLAGDFVKPLGRGMVKDLELRYTREETGPFEWRWTFSVRFSNPADGLVPVVFDAEGSEFASGYEAPRDGYLGEWTVEKSRAGMNDAATGNTVTNRGYYFRVRTHRALDGTVRGGHYGKIYSEFPRVTYYANPEPGDRNVEWDPSRNRLAPLPVQERPTKP